MRRVERAPAWAEAVFHVLAHVDVPYPSSCFNPAYATRVAPPALDHAEIAQYVRSHAQLAAANALAFDAALPESAEPLVEIVRAHAELEVERLPRWERPATVLDDALARVVPAAPMLEDFHIEVTPPLGLRGRVCGARIIVGHPAYDDPELIAWQAAHEATVASLTGGYTTIEREALRLLRERAVNAGLTGAHGRWLAGLGAVPDIDDGA